MNGVFIGRYEIDLDGSGAMQLPEEWRTLLPSDGFLYLLAGEEDGQRMLNLLPVSEADSVKVPVDPDGRLVLPTEMRAYAEIETRAVLLGVVRYIRIFGKDPAADDESDSTLDEILRESLG